MRAVGLETPLKSNCTDKNNRWVFSIKNRLGPKNLVFAIENLGIERDDAMKIFCTGLIIR